MGIKLVVVGTGTFGGALIPLFKAHPLVDDIALCDLDAAKLHDASARYGIPKTYPHLDAACDSNVDAVAITTQHWLHSPQAVKALQAGKNVFSAVPAGITVEEVATLVRTVEETGRIYMLGETSYYYPWVVYCRERYAAGDFGRVVYSEADYYHDFWTGTPTLLDVMKQRGGDRWQELAVIPPMYYATHSTSEVISVTGARMTHVSCCGFADREGDGVFVPEVNSYGNAFSNESALFRMSDGSSCRVNVFWRSGHPPTPPAMSMYGTNASYEQNTAGAIWLTRERQTRLDDQMAAGMVRPGLGRPSWMAKPAWLKPSWIPGGSGPARARAPSTASSSRQRRYNP